MTGKGVLSRIKIIVVDDDPNIGGLIVDFLRTEGCNPVYYNEPLEALEFSQKNRFDLAFVDMNMPDMNGLELASELKERSPEGEIVFVTGFGSFDNAVQAIKVGAYDYLRKPFTISELKLCVKRFQGRLELADRVKIAEHRYSQIVQNVPSLVFVVRKDFGLEFINRACEHMLGFKPEEAVKDPEWLVQRIHPDDFERMKRLFISAFKSSSSRFTAECRLIHREGYVVYVMIGATAQMGTEREMEIERLEGIIMDITDRVYSERALVQEEKLKILNSISAEVAHEIRNPLMSIGGFARRLRKRFPELREGDIILNESERLERLLKRIAEYLKPVEVNLQKCSFNEVVTDCLEQLTLETHDYSPNYHLKLASNLEEISIDRQILSKIFLDLLKNSSKRVNKSSRIDIRTFGTDKNIYIELKNRCRDPKLEDLEPFFLPFNESRHESTLPLSYRLMKNMGGLLSFSQGEREMTFMVTLPKHATPVTEIYGKIAS